MVDPVERHKEGEGRGGTLVVCPPSLIDQWETQIHSHTRCKSLVVKKYLGVVKAAVRDELHDCDVLLATYGMVVSDWKRWNDYHLDCVLFAHKRKVGEKSSKDDVYSRWTRVVLDEAHVVHNQASKTFEAVAALGDEKTRRWAVTGTPFQNNLRELHSLMVFIRAKPFDQQSAGVLFNLREEHLTMSPSRNTDLANR
eukprot:TRINITY_DN3507_c0_g1_i1.p1 TRINITY_DN3507_c0_g1~~TRINITY_DN3507_c0_g1_i1.p1  ORF type:complete len:197 (-),score=30.61 TRINITY_DN3507_c0_g1_i1:49-639(-)